MFTGLVEEVGTLQGVHRGSNSAVLTIGARTVLEGTQMLNVPLDQMSENV